MNAIPNSPDSPVAAPQRSGGPRTAKGKEASRKNALKHGLRAKVVFPEELAEIVELRVLDFNATFAPRGSYENMLVRDMAVSSSQFERCASLSVVDLVRSVERVADHWDDDRSASVEDYAAKLAKDPSRIARGLLRTTQGCDWLIKRWDALAKIARKIGRWDEEQRKLAFHLLGVPNGLQTLAGDVPAGDQRAELIELAESWIKELRDRQTSGLDGLDESERDMALIGMPIHEDIVTARLRKAESRARRDFNKARAELLRFRSDPLQEKRFREPERPTCKPPLTQAAADNLYKRSQLMTTNLVVIPSPVVVEPVVEPTPAVPVRKGNRAYRKAQARRERDAAGRETR